MAGGSNSRGRRAKSSTVRGRSLPRNSSEGPMSSPWGGGTFRVDRLLLKRAGDTVNGLSVTGKISEIEYQGTYVRVAIAIEDRADISAQLSESQFDAANYRVGERVIATWDPELASRLSPRSSATI